MSILISKRKKILLVAGEASGDLHAANLVRALVQLNPDIECYGMGGSSMERAGVRLTHDLRRVSVIGLVEVLSRLPVILRTLKELERGALVERPNLAILIDFPDFNLRLAERLKRQGIPIVWYISPQVWAWRAERIPRFAAVVDYMLVILPFEVEFYRRHNLQVHFVGHPLIDVVKPSLPKHEILKRHGLRESDPIIALLPGSRRVELKLLLDHLLGAARLLHAADPQRQFLLPAASTVDTALLRRRIERVAVPVSVVEGATYDVLAVADCAAVAAGTATLETALLGTPEVIVGRVTPLTWFLWSRYTKLPYYGLPNYILEQKFIPELIQHQADAAGIARHLEQLLGSQQLREQLKAGYEVVRQRLGGIGASVNAARLITKILEGEAVERFNPATAR